MWRCVNSSSFSASGPGCLAIGGRCGRLIVLGDGGRRAAPPLEVERHVVGEGRVSDVLDPAQGGGQDKQAVAIEVAAGERRDGGGCRMLVRRNRKIWGNVVDANGGSWWEGWIVVSSVTGSGC